MARYYRTPDVFMKTRRNSKNFYEDGTPVKDDDYGKSYLAPNVEYRLIEAVRELTSQQEKKKRGRKAVTQTQLFKEAKVSSASKSRYEYIVIDLIEMINKFKLGTREKDKGEEDIPSFDKLEDETKKKTRRFMAGIYEAYTTEILEYFGKDLQDKVEEAQAAQTSAYGSKRIHPDLLMGINEIPAVIIEKYNRVQELMERYNELRAKL